MPKNPAQKSLFQRQIPTILGLLILMGALAVGVFAIGQGTGVFAPRATPETTPNKVKITNVTDSSFTVSFITAEATPGFVRYGTEAGRLNSQSSDDRDQLTGSINPYRTHHITVRGLSPNTSYYYVLGTGEGATFDNNGDSFSVRTVARSGAPSAAKTAYGNVLDASGNPAEGSIVYAVLEGVGEMSTLVKGAGSWAIPLSNARLADGSGYASVTDDNMMAILVQGPDAGQTSTTTVQVSATQPLADFTLGQDLDSSLAMAGDNAVDPDLNLEPLGPDQGDEMMGDEMMEDELGLDDPDAGLGGDEDELMEPADPTDENVSGGLEDLLSEGTTATRVKTELDLEAGDGQVLTTGNPIIKGTAAPNVEISITVNSETQINQTLTADENGNFELDIAALSEELEPGEHTVTYSYTDPETGELIEKTVSFTVEDPDSGTTQIAQANTTPNSSADPYPVGGTTESATATESAEASPSATATESADMEGTRSAMPATTSAIPVSGSVGVTFALILGGLFFIFAGGWSFWLAQEMGRVEEV